MQDEVDAGVDGAEEVRDRGRGRGVGDGQRGGVGEDRDAPVRVRVRVRGQGGGEQVGRVGGVRAEGLVRGGRRVLAGCFVLFCFGNGRGKGRGRRGGEGTYAEAGDEDGELFACGRRGRGRAVGAHCFLFGLASALVGVVACVGWTGSWGVRAVELVGREREGGDDSEGSRFCGEWS